jgi:hypothetical protein
MTTYAYVPNDKLKGFAEKEEPLIEIIRVVSVKESNKQINLQYYTGCYEK